MKLIINQCEHCEKNFEATRVDAKFCSGACRQGAYNYRQRSKMSAKGIKNETNNSELWEMFRSLQKEYAEFVNQRVQTPKPIVEHDQRMQEMIDSFKVDREKRKIDYANNTLKDWLIKLIDYSQQKEVSVIRLNSFFRQIQRGYDFYFIDLPISFKYHQFINETLKPRIARWSYEINKSTERNVCFELPKELMTAIEEILTDIG